VASVYKTERRTEHQSQQQDNVQSDQQETATFQRRQYRASDMPSQSTDTDHYMDIVDMSSDQVEETSPVRDQETTSFVIEYENLDLPYEGLDASTLVNQGPPEPSVYDTLSH